MAQAIRGQPGESVKKRHVTDRSYDGNVAKMPPEKTEQWIEKKLDELAKEVSKMRPERQRELEALLEQSHDEEA